MANGRATRSAGSPTSGWRAALWSTASDVLRFGRDAARRRFDGTRVLSPAFVDLMTREVTVGGPGARPTAQAHHYAPLGQAGHRQRGLAVSVRPRRASGTRLWIDPAHDLVFVYLSGSWALPLAPIDAVQHAVYAALP
jgi:CubicO group peptidase (beta-lactamase class C family)